MSAQERPEVLVKDMGDGKGSKLIICRYIPYVITPSDEFGHILAILVEHQNEYNIQASVCPLGIVESLDSGIKYILTKNKNYLIEVA